MNARQNGSPTVTICHSRDARELHNFLSLWKSNGCRSTPFSGIADFGFKDRNRASIDVLETNPS
jgi:hypothetical protein